MKKLNNVGAFLYILFCTGFTLGTITLSVIVENLVTYLRHSGNVASYENIIVITIILIYLLYSFLFSIWLTKYFAKLSRAGKAVLLSTLTLFTAMCLWYWMHPAGTISEYIIVSNDQRFVAGPYPDKNTIETLKKQGYTAIISLLSPYVLPFEPVLINEEKEEARKAGIPVIEIPMLPWVTKNTDSINKIIALASAKNHNKYYVHCYYGRDRVSMFMRIVNQYSPVTSLTENYPAPQTGIENLHTVQFERGTAIEINKSIIFAPMPTEDEFLRFVVAVNNPYFGVPIHSVVSIQSSEASVTPAEKSLKHYGINFSVITIDNLPYDPLAIFNAAKQIRAMPGPTLVYTYYADPDPMPATLKGILISYLTNLPVLPLQVFESLKLTNGKVEAIAPNIAIGPQPTEEEYGNTLFYLGIRAIAYIGDCNDNQYKSNLALALSAHLTFSCFQPTDDNLTKQLAHGGPWYVYGPKTEMIEDNIENAFRHSIPDLKVK